MVEFIKYSRQQRDISGSFNVYSLLTPLQKLKLLKQPLTFNTLQNPHWTKFYWITYEEMVSESPLSSIHTHSVSSTAGSCELCTAIQNVDRTDS